MGSAIGYKICSVDGSKLYKSENKEIFKNSTFTLLDTENGRLNFSKIDMTFDNSLDIEYLRDVVYPRHSKEMNGKHLLVGKDKKSTTAIINVTFKYSIKDFEHRGDGFYVLSGENFDKDLLVDHIYIDENGELKAIEVINHEKRNKKDYKSVQTPERDIKNKCEYFEFRDEERNEDGSIKTPAAYYLVKNGKGESKIGTNKSKHKENNKSIKEIREYLYNKGFTVDGMHYQRYKRSAGSGRDGSCLFIADPLYKDMMDWSSCGINGDLIKDKASWEAYISLTLSEKIGEICIPKESILLLPDVKVSGYDNVVAVNRGEEKDGETVALTAERKRVKYENKIWDGEALLDESVFEELERINIEQSKDKTKHGMMLLRNRMFKTCAFRTRLKSFFAENRIDDVKKLHGYTLAKNVNDIKLVITESSIKYIKLAESLFPESSIEDRFKTWLDVIYSNKFGSRFGIVKQDKKSGPMDNKCVYTNYQLINTLALNKNDVKDLLADSLDLLHKIQKDSLYLRYQGEILSADETEVGENYIDNTEYEPESNYRFELIRELLSRNDEAYKLQIYKDYRKDLTDNFKKRIKHGRIIVEGNYQTLFGNPLEFLYATIGVDYTKLPRFLLDGEIYTRRFEDGKALLCARSPHITMGNVLLARNKYIPEIDKYFHLGDADSIVCVNAIESNIMQRLNGCDYDSDTMLITDNQILLAAAKDHLEKFPVPHSEINEKNDEHNNDEKSSNLCDLDIKISQNKIGEIVNLSQFLNSLYWHKLSLGETSELDEIYDDICKLAVLSGIEIDRAKRDMKISAPAILRSLRERWKVRYVGDEKRGIPGPGGLPKFFVELTDKSGNNRSKMSNDAVLNTPLSYVYDTVINDECRSDSSHVIPYVDFFKLEYSFYDQNAKRRAKNFLEYAEYVQKDINMTNMNAKCSNESAEGKVKKKLYEAVLESEKYLKSDTEYWYAFELMGEMPCKKNEGNKKETQKRVKRNNIALYLLCFANNMKLIENVTSVALMKDLKQDDTLLKEEVYDIIYGHPHKII